VENQQGGIVTAKSSKPVDLRDRLRGVEPSSHETPWQADMSQGRLGFPSKRRRRHR